MRRTDLRLIFVRFGILFPPVPRYTHAGLASIYADLCERHTLDSIEVHGVEGASMGTEETLSLDLARSSLRIDELAQCDLTLVSKDFADIVGTLQRRLHIYSFFEPRVELRALWPLENQNDDVGDALIDRAIDLTDEELEHLEGLKVQDIGLQLRADTADQELHGHFTLSLMPYVSDTSQLHIVTETWTHQRFDTPEGVEERLQDAYSYLTTKVADFIASFMP